MGLWSRIKKAVKKAVKAVVNFVRAAVRVFIKGWFGFFARVKNVVGEFLTGGQVRKKMRIQILILRDEAGNALTDESDLDAAVKTAVGVFRSEFNVDLIPYGKPLVQILSDSAPTAALDVRCDGGAFLDEIGDAGAYFASKVAGWVGIPISLKFPVTAFVVRKIRDKIGCSIPIADYVTLADTSPDPNSAVTGVTSATTLAHELAHTCLLMHRNDEPDNLLYPDYTRGTSTTWWQRRVMRTSRHCTFT